MFLHVMCVEMYVHMCVRARSHTGAPRLVFGIILGQTAPPSHLLSQRLTVKPDAPQCG